MHTGKAAAILMASGFSRRFGGRNKLLVPFRGKPLARHTLDMVCSMKHDAAAKDSLEDCFSGIFFVTQDEQVAALANGLPVTLIRNNAPEKGRQESIRLGIEAADELGCQSRPGYYFFFPCDQPFLDQQTVRRILAARRPGCIVEPCYQDLQSSLGCHSSPSLFSAAFRDELLTLGNGEKPRIIKARHPNALISIEITNLSALFDIDTPEDINKMNFTSSPNAG